MLQRNGSRPEVTELVGRTAGNASAAGQREAVIGADIVVVAVPGGVAEEVTRGLGDLSGKIILDPTNRVGPSEDGWLAGDDPEAKAVVAELITGMGLEVMDFGPLRYAHVLEEMLIVWANARTQGTPYNYHLRPQPVE